jgi:hypothetical protein
MSILVGRVLVWLGDYDSAQQQLELGLGMALAQGMMGIERSRFGTWAR